MGKGAGGGGGGGGGRGGGGPRRYGHLSSSGQSKRHLKARPGFKAYPYI